MTDCNGDQACNWWWRATGTLLLTWAMIGPRVYCNSVCPDLPIDDAVERITRSQLRMLQLHGVVPG